MNKSLYPNGILNSQDYLIKKKPSTKFSASPLFLSGKTNECFMTNDLALEINSLTLDSTNDQNKQSFHELSDKSKHSDYFLSSHSNCNEKIR